MILTKNADLKSADFQAGTMLLVDKPAGWTSFDVVNKIRFRLRHLLGVKKIKVGHSGTLDPFATGLLILCTGKWTKKLGDLQGLDKKYSGVIHLGATTPSYDNETEEDQQFPFEHISKDAIEEARKSFLGEIQQIPPMYSAIKVDGQPLYKKARNGIKIEIQPRTLQIFDFQVESVELPNITFSVHCSKGTYIRSLAYDFGKTLESGAYLTALRRDTISDYTVEDAWEVETLVSALEALGQKAL